MYKTKFSLKNFRVFGDNGGDFDISPITILTGCNSSGKSSTLKALMLLNASFKKLISEYRNNQNLNLQNTELIFNKGKHNLATYRKTISRYSDSKEMIFSWATFSPLFADNLTIEYVFRENDSNILNNGVLSKINIKSDNEDLVTLNFDGKFWYKLNFLLLKKHFFIFDRIVEYYNTIVKAIGSDDDGIPFGFPNEDSISDPKYALNKEAIDIIVHCHNELSTNGERSSLLDKFKNLSTGSETLFYLPILDWLKDVPKEDVSTIIWRKFEEYNSLNPDQDKTEKDQGLAGVLSEILKEFHESEFESFIDFYNNVENDLLNRLSDNERSCFWFQDWTYSFEDHIRNDLDSIDMFKHVRFDTYEWQSMKEYGLSNYKKLDELYVKFMCLVDLCDIDKELMSGRIIDDAEPMRGYFQYLDTKEISAAVEYMIALLKDIIFNPPSFVQKIDFVDAVRVNTQRIYTFSNQGTEFNEVLLNYLNTNAKAADPHEPGIKPYVLGTFMKKWTKEFNIADDVIFENTEEGLGVLIYLVKNNKKELLADQGYGISQLLSILLRIELNIINSEYTFRHPLLDWHRNLKTTKYKESTVCIEEPETNLHPKYQSKLALMFMDAYKSYNVRFLLETHSEYLIRKFQTLVATKEMDMSEIAIHYIYDANPNNRPKDKPHVQIIPINEDGKLNEPFGAGFFDEADNLALELLTLKSVN